MWRLAYILILLFWASMTGMLVQRTYFPEGGGMREIELSNVLERMAQYGDSMNSLALVRGGQKVGHVTVNCRHWRDDETLTLLGYSLQAGGMMDGSAWQKPQATLSWNFAGRVDEQRVWRALDLRLRTQDVAVVLMWDEAMKEPQIEVMRDGKLVMNTQSLLSQAKMMTSLPGLDALPMLKSLTEGKGDIPIEKAIHLSASEGRLELAGQQRRALQVVASLAGLANATALLTETGELARVDLPNGYQMLDPIIFGLSASEAP
jgi:hypothetical protein